MAAASRSPANYAGSANAANAANAINTAKLTRGGMQRADIQARTAYGIICPY